MSYVTWFLFISVDDTIPVDGYLVAWQYYLRHFSGSECSGTVVTVWRRIGESYHMIGQTILTPANVTDQGPRFQCVHNQVIRVKKGDHLGTYTTVQGCWNVISATDTGGWRRFSDGPFNGDRQVLDSPRNETGTNSIIKRDFALRAFVAGLVFQFSY